MTSVQREGVTSETPDTRQRRIDKAVALFLAGKQR